MPRGSDKTKRKRRKNTPRELEKKAAKREAKRKRDDERRSAERQAQQEANRLRWINIAGRNQQEDNPEPEPREVFRNEDQPAESAEQHHIDTQGEQTLADDGQDASDGETVGDSGSLEEKETEDGYDMEIMQIDDEDDVEVALGCMSSILIHVQSRIQLETGPEATDNWLLRHLKKNDFWIRASHHTGMIVEKLGLPCSRDDQYYYRDIKVWLPDLQWGQEATPVCTTCEKADEVRFHGWRDNHFGRRICRLDGHYFIMSRRYICRGCQKDHSEEESYTFMGWDAKSLEGLPFGYGDRFPAFLTCRGGLDKQLVDLMRPLFNKGFRPEPLAHMMTELHTKVWTRAYLQREFELERDRRMDPTLPEQIGMFSPFSDRNKYAGMVPTGRYLESVYKKHYDTIEAYYDLEIKKRGAARIHIDGHFKEANHLGKFHGKKIWEGLVNVTNEYHEIRSQFHITSESHDQLRPPLEAMIDTMEAYGQPLPHLATSDKPAQDKAFLLDIIPSLQRKQDEFDAILISVTDATTNTDATTENDDMPICTVVPSDYTVVSTSDEINLRVDALRAQMESSQKKICAIDAEWVVVQLPTGGKQPKRVSLIQLGSKAGGTTKALMMRFTGRAHRRGQGSLPTGLRALFEDTSITFIGVKVVADLKKIGRDFNCEELMKPAIAKAVDLGMMARRRDVVQDARVGMRPLVALCLGENLPKEDDTIFSDWESSSGLSKVQKEYAALDVIKPIEVYNKLIHLPDLSQRLSRTQAGHIGLAVDIVPSSGEVGDLATVAATGKIVADDYWQLPLSGNPKKCDKAKQVMVEIDQVLAKSLAIPRLKDKGTRLSVSHFGDPPFKLALPRRMLRPHADGTNARIYQSKTEKKRYNQRRQLDLDLRSTVACDDESSTNILDNDDDDNVEDEDPGLTADIAAQAIRLTEAALAAAERQSDPTSGHAQQVKLDPAPTSITDTASSVVGCGFHGTDRVKVAVRHDYKKAYKYAFMEGLYCWDKEILANVKSVLRDHDMTETEIKSKLYFHTDYFKQCVPRVILPPTRLYWRIRAVFCLFGPLKDSKTGKPLFNDEAWKKAQSFLNEILLGVVSDPPGIDFYSPKYDPSSGQIMVNRHGIPLLVCDRTNSVLEGMHKQLCDAFGTWSTGCHMGNCILGEFRHRYTTNMSERRRPGFPKIGHYDSWLVDRLQTLVLGNHGKMLYKGWLNTNAFLPTPETFGTVALQSKELTDRINQIEVDDAAKKKLSAELVHLCKRSGTQLPLLPVHFKDELILYNKLALACSNRIDEEELALDWCEHVNGVTIFPKTPAQLMKYRKVFGRNQRVKDAMKKIACLHRGLRHINNVTDTQEPMTETQCLQDLLLPIDIQPPSRNNITVALNAFPEQPSWGLHSCTTAQASFILPRVHDRLTTTLQTAAGMRLDPICPPLNLNQQPDRKRRGQRGPCKQPRKKARCMSCISAGMSDHTARSCPGSQPKRKSGCPTFHKDGSTK